MEKVKEFAEISYSKIQKIIQDIIKERLPRHFYPVIFEISDEYANAFQIYLLNKKKMKKRVRFKHMSQDRTSVV